MHLLIFVLYKLEWHAKQEFYRIFLEKLHTSVFFFIKTKLQIWILEGEMTTDFWFWFLIFDFDDYYCPKHNTDKHMNARRP